MDNNLKNKRILTFIIIFFSVFLIVSLILLLLSNRQHFSITNDSNIDSSFFQNNKDKMIDRIWNILKQKDDLSIFTSISDVVIREETYQEEIEDNYYILSFIIDSDSLKQTYQIYVLATEKEIEEVKVNCVKNDVTKYPQTPCIDESGSTQDIRFNLPYYSVLDNGKKFYIEHDRYIDNRIIVKIPDACGDESLVDEAKQKTIDWINNKLYLNSNDYEIEIIYTLCNKK